MVTCFFRVKTTSTVEATTEATCDNELLWFELGSKTIARDMEVIKVLVGVIVVGHRDYE